MHNPLTEKTRRHAVFSPNLLVNEALGAVRLPHAHVEELLWIARVLGATSQLLRRIRKGVEVRVARRRVDVNFHLIIFVLSAALLDCSGCHVRDRIVY